MLTLLPIYLQDEQIERTEYGEIWNYFATNAAFSAQVGADIFVSLNKYKIKVKDEAGILKKRKIREIVVTVRDDVRVNDEQAEELFNVVKKAIEEDENLKVQPWHRADELGKRQMVWAHEYGDGKSFLTLRVGPDLA